MISYLQHKEIDKSRWDELIDKSPNGIIYAQSWYLDIVCPDWDAIVLNNYQAGMPLPRRKKYILHYIFKPFHIQQLGLFHIARINNDDINLFLNTIPKKFVVADIVLNEENIYIPGKYECLTKQNNKLKIDCPYNEILKGFNNNCIRNIKKTVNSGLSISKSISSSDFSDFIFENLKNQIDSLNKNDFEILKILMDETIRRKKGELICIKNKHQEIIAAGAFFFSSDRLICSFRASSCEGKKNQAMYMLVNEQIKKYANKFKWFDFSGSNIPGIAYFNSTFGAKVSEYQTIRIKRFPLQLKFFTIR